MRLDNNVIRSINMNYAKAFEGARFLGVVILGVAVCWILSQLCTVATSSPFNQGFQCWVALIEIRKVLYSHEKGNDKITFCEWRRDRDKSCKSESLATQICGYCKEYASRGTGLKFKIRKVDGVDVLIDPWGSPFNVDKLTRFPSKDIRDALLECSPDGIAIWSSGPNGINEYGDGDDMLVVPKSWIRTRKRREMAIGK